MTPDRHLADWDAAYLLGALSAEETVEYERFLAAEPGHAAALRDYDGLTDVLDLLPRNEALSLLDDDTAAPPSVASLAAAAQRRRTRTRRARAAAALATAAALLLIGGFVGYATVSGEAPTGPALQAMAAGQRAGVTASLAVTEEPWGTRLDWQCQYTKEWATNVESYDLVVTTKDGRQTAIASWSPAGEQATGLAAATVIPTSDIRSIDIREAGTATPLAVTTLG